MAEHDNRRMDWFHEQRFGIFLHWGAYSLAGVEASWPIMTPGTVNVLFGEQPKISYSEYVALAERFDPREYDPARWVEIARAAGAGYMILTSKHHDGFCMFDAPGTDYKITSSPFGRDICKEFADACTAAGMRYGFYYSQPDLHHPGYRDVGKRNTANWFGEPARPEWGSYLDYMETHLRKLLTDYGDVSVLWFDGLSNLAKYDPPRFVRLIRSMKPDILINDRLGEEYDYVTPEQTVPKGGVPVRRTTPAPKVHGGDELFRKINPSLRLPIVRGKVLKFFRRYAEGELDLDSTPTAPCPSPDEYQPWETCMTMNRSWGYVPTDTAWKPVDALVRTLVSTAASGGNLLLNVGPRPDGTFPPEAVERLGKVGEWFSRNGKAIRGSTYDCLYLPAGIRSTKRDGTRFLFVVDRPGSRSVKVERFPAAPVSVSHLGGGPLPFSFEDGTLTIELGPVPEGELVPVIEVE